MDHNRLAVGFALLIGLSVLVCLQSIGIADPLTDAHAWRQTDTAAMARNFYRHDMRLFYPEIDWGGETGYVESEFPLMPFLVAISYHLFGMHEFLGRIVSMLFSVGTASMAFSLARTYFGNRVGWMSVWGLAASPLLLFFGRTFMPEAAMLFFSVTLLYAYSRWLDTESRAWLAGAALAGALAFMVKIPALYLLGPLAVLSFTKLGWKTLVRKEIWLLGLLMLLPTVLWYGHAAGLRQQTGLTFNIWSIGQDKWGNLTIWSNPEFYQLMWQRLHQDVVSPFGLFLGVVGLILPARDERRRRGWLLLLAWAGSIAFYVFVIARGNMVHNYYQLPLVPVLAIGIGRTLSGVIDLSKIVADRFKWPLPSRILGWCAVGIATLGLVWSSWSFVDKVYRRHPMTENAVLYEAGQIIQQMTQPDDLLLINYYDQVRQPELFYYADRKGWLFDIKQCNLQKVEARNSQGAGYLVVVGVETDVVQFQSDPCLEVLESRFPTAAAAGNWLIFRLD